MRTKSRSARQRFQPRRDEYRELNPTCELRRYLHGPIVHEFKGSYLEWNTFEVHHIAGSGHEYHECFGNYITLSMVVHDWIHNRTTDKGACWYPGFVLCCWAKRQKGELDWPLLERAKGKCLPSWLDTDVFRNTCGQWDCTETKRLILLEGT